jgi:hypothetical protein
MKSRLIFALSVAILFLSTSILTFSQSKTNTADKSTKAIQVKQVTPTTNKQMEKTTAVKTNKKVENSKQLKKTEKTSKVKGQKVTKSKTTKVAHNKVMMHHKKMDKKTTKPESSTPQKK